VVVAEHLEAARPSQLEPQAAPLGVNGVGPAFSSCGATEDEEEEGREGGDGGPIIHSEVMRRE
jgi:hypothetical protein